MSSIPASRPQPIVPIARRLYGPLEPYAYTLIRAATGAIFIPHGVQKVFLVGAGYGLGVLELVAGLLVVLGVLVRPMALLLIIDVLLVIAANIGKGWLWTRGGVQYHTFLLGMLIAVAIGGAGRYAIPKAVEERLRAMGSALARVGFALLILPSGYEKVFTDGVSRIAAGNLLKTPFQP